MSEGLGMSLDDYIKSSKGGKSDRGDNRYSRGRGNRGNFQRKQNFRNYDTQRNERNDRPFQNRRKGNWEHDMYENNDSQGFFSKRGIQSNNEGRPVKSISTAMYKTTLRISNLYYGVIDKELNELFSQFGEIKRCNIDWDEFGRSKGTAIVEYYDEEAAAKAIEEYNGAELDGQKLLIEYTFLPKIKKFGIRKDFNNNQRRGFRRFNSGYKRNNRGGF